jgi:Zn-dependent protease
MLGFPEERNSVLAPLTLLAYHGVVINLILCVFNMIPVMPLDGAAVLSGILPRSLAEPFEQLQNYGFMILIALIFLGIPAFLYMPVIRVVRTLLVAI